MAVIKCKMCGGDLEFTENATVGTCPYCLRTQTLPRLIDDRRANLYDRANHYRRNNEFDKAEGIYEQILNEDTSDAEAYWSLVLCRYGIEYVEDPATHRHVPTVNRIQYTSVFDDENYKAALTHADAKQRPVYEEEAAAINEIQKGFLAISQKEAPFDVFICYKETDENGERTVDSVLANDLYYQLTQEGFKVFFSRITLENKLGEAYEPYIFAALNSAKVMVVLGTKPEYFNAVWVKNEWSRYLALVKQSNGKKVLIPAYRDMDPYDLPEEFSHLQAQDMNKLGFMQDLIRGIKKLTGKDMIQKPAAEPVIVNTGNASAAPLLRRAFLFLEDGDWAKADDFCEQVLNLEPENPYAYLGKLMAELQVRRQQDLANCPLPFDQYDNFKKAVRFGDEELSAVLNGYISHIIERNENNRLNGIYDQAVAAMNASFDEYAFEAAAAIFQTIPGFRDSDILYTQCMENARRCHDEAVALEEAAREREKEREKARAEAERRAKEQKAFQEREMARQAAENRKTAAARRRKRLPFILAAFLIVTAIVIFNKKVIKPKKTYNAAMKQYEVMDYEAAYNLFNSSDYQDSQEKAAECLFQLQQYNLSGLSVGSTVRFGAYEQDDKTSDGKEEIEWIVLAVEGDRALLVSQYILDSQKFNEFDSDVTWADCSLRNWLNGEFYNEAFGTDHQMMIADSAVTADPNSDHPDAPAGIDATDQIFLLSIPEMEQYEDYCLGSPHTSCEPTKYAKAQGAKSVWWLRT
ncbi:MAG: toll/interleukin-1 receptor domain-containing protein, partial [Lachnospiraceae bacterium]|nr:toll/interleukin-1 receptor domain-containing protein [Lachnospiraceae bacterium]